MTETTNHKKSRSFSKNSYRNQLRKRKQIQFNYPQSDEPPQYLSALQNICFPYHPQNQQPHSSTIIEPLKLAQKQFTELSKHSKAQEDNNNLSFEYRVVTTTVTTGMGERHFVACMICYCTTDPTTASSSTGDAKEQKSPPPFMYCLVSDRPLFSFCKQLFKSMFDMTLMPHYRNSLLQKGQYIPIEFYLWLTFTYFGSVKGMARQVDEMRVFADRESQFVQANLDFECLRIFTPSQLIKLFTCMLLEFKIIFITPAETTEYLADMPNMFECLLELISPISKHIYSLLPFIYSEDMCLIMQKPGNLICALTEEMWMKAGRQVHQQDPSYTLIINISESPTVLSTEMFSLPQVIDTLLTQSLLTQDMNSLQHQVTLKQAFYNALLVICSIVQDTEDPFLEEFTRTTCYQDLMDRLDRGQCQQMKSHLDMMDAAGHKDDLFQKLIDQQGNQIAESFSQFQNIRIERLSDLTQRLQGFTRQSPFKICDKTLLVITEQFKGQSPRKIKSLMRAASLIPSTSKPLNVGDEAMGERTSHPQRSFFEMAFDFITGGSKPSFKLKEESSDKSLDLCLEEDEEDLLTTKQQNPSSDESVSCNEEDLSADETPQNVASEGKGSFQLDFSHQTSNKQSDGQLDMPFVMAVDAIKKSSNEEIRLHKVPNKKKLSQSLRELHDNHNSSAHKLIRKTPKVVKKTNINLQQLVKSTSLNSVKSQSDDHRQQQQQQTNSEGNTATRLHQIIRRATMNQSVQVPPPSIAMPRVSVTTATTATANTIPKFSTRDELKTPPKQITQRKIENRLSTNQAPPVSSQEVTQTEASNAQINPQNSLSPRLLNSSRVSVKTQPNLIMKTTTRAKAMSQYLKKDSVTTASTIKGQSQRVTRPSGLVVQNSKIKRIEQPYKGCTLKLENRYSGGKHQRSPSSQMLFGLLKLPENSAAEEQTQQLSKSYRLMGAYAKLQ